MYHAPLTEIQPQRTLKHLRAGNSTRAKLFFRQKMQQKRKPGEWQQVSPLRSIPRLFSLLVATRPGSH